jgi:hypothetical protein
LSAQLSHFSAELKYDTTIAQVRAQAAAPFDALVDFNSTIQRLNGEYTIPRGPSIFPASSQGDLLTMGSDVGGAVAFLQPNFLPSRPSAFLQWSGFYNQQIRTVMVDAGKVTRDLRRG